MRFNQRKFNELRPVSFTRFFTEHAEGSVLATFGKTKVICNASVIEGVPRFLREGKQGWLTAEYAMLPRATHERNDRESVRGKQEGRSLEIQRLIGRVLRSALDLTKLGKYTIAIDCDVLQADGGTRTAAISGSCVALIDALRYMQRKGLLLTDPLKYYVGAVSVGICHNKAMLDLDYREDSQAETDMNIIMTEFNDFVEIQGTAEGKTFTSSQLNEMTALAEEGIKQIIALQKVALSDLVSA